MTRRRRHRPGGPDGPTTSRPQVGGAGKLPLFLHGGRDFNAHPLGRLLAVAAVHLVVECNNWKAANQMVCREGKNLSGITGLHQRKKYAQANTTHPHAR